MTNRHNSVSGQERDYVSEQQTVLRQLEAILSIHKLARVGHYLDALREVAKLPFLPLDPRAPDITADGFDSLSPHVQACVPELLKVSLNCLDNVTDSDGSLRALRRKVRMAIAMDLSYYSVLILMSPLPKSSFLLFGIWETSSAN